MHVQWLSILATYKDKNLQHGFKSALHVSVLLSWDAHSSVLVLAQQKKKVIIGAPPQKKENMFSLKVEMLL